MTDLILVVEDEPKITKLARDYLENSGYRVISAGDGKTGLAAFRHDQPDLVVLDLNLPGMDGLDVCRAIRRESDVPIIMLKARVEEIEQLIGLELGADDCIFDRFWSRAGGSGSGLGLAIARSLVQAHGGQIEAASQPGARTAVRIELPRRRFDAGL